MQIEVLRFGENLHRTFEVLRSIGPELQEIVLQSATNEEVRSRDGICVFAGDDEMSDGIVAAPFERGGIHRATERGKGSVKM